MTTSPDTMLQAAVDLVIRGCYVAPLCHPTPDLRCGCGRRESHVGNQIGKAAIAPHGIRDSVATTREIWELWHRYPRANIGIDLSRSGLLGVGPDSAEWLDRFQEWGLPETMTARSGGGEGHLHYYYRRPEGCPIYCTNRSGEYDIQADNYFVAPPSIHPSGNPYTWVTPLQYVQDLPEAPAWAVKMLQEREQDRPVPVPVAAGADTAPVAGVGPPVRLSGRALDWWEGRLHAVKADGEIDRSRTLFIIGLVLAGANATEPVIAQALAERDVTLGYYYYVNRPDQHTRYSDIARRVVTPRAMSKGEGSRDA